MVVGQQAARADGDQKSALFLKSDNDAAQKILRATGHLDATAGQVAEGQQQAGAEGDAQKRAKAQTLRSLEEVLVVAREVFLPRSAEDPRTVPNIGEIPRSPPPEQSGPPIPTTSREHGGPFSEDVERIFEILRNRIGLSGS